MNRAQATLELASLIGSQDQDTAAWALQRFSALPNEDKMVAYETMFEGMEPLFGPHLDLDGQPLPAWKTRYLDETLMGLNDTTVLQDMALRLTIVPRDLEMMLFYVYGNFDADKMYDPHATEYGPTLIAKASTHLAGDDGARILEASYYIYILREMTYPPDEASMMASYLRSIVGEMDIEASYSLSFSNKSSRIMYLHGDE
jgi:hypothetical protein